MFSLRSMLPMWSLTTIQSIGFWFRPWWWTVTGFRMRRMISGKKNLRTKRILTAAAVRICFISMSRLESFWILWIQLKTEAMCPKSSHGRSHQSWCPANAPAPRGITQSELHYIKRIRWMPNPLLLVRLPWAIAWWWKFTTRLVVGSDIPTDWSACYFTIEKKLRNKCFGRMLYNRFTLASK